MKRLRPHAGLLAVALIAAVALAAVVAAGCLLRISATAGDIWYVVILAVLGLYALGAAALVAQRRGATSVALALASLGAVPCLICLGDTYDSVLARAPGQLPDPSPYWVGFSQGLWMLWYLPVAFLLLVFPDGRLPSRRWRPVAAALIGVPVLFSVAAAFDPSPYAAPYQHLRHPFAAPRGVWTVVDDVVGAACLLGLLALLFVSASAVLLRLRRADGIRRAQLKWFVLAAGFLPGTLLLCWLSYLVLGGPDLVMVGLIGMMLAIPTATAIALLRHDLYDVDRALSAATTYALACAGVLALFTVASVGGGLVLGHRSPAIAAVATALCAAALAPLRTRLRRAVDRRLDPRRRRVLDDIAALRTSTDAGTASPEQLSEVLADALGDPSAHVAFLTPGATVTHTAVLAAGTVSTPIELGQQVIGQLITGPQHSRALLREIASASALLVELARLRGGLADALAEVQHSRARLVRTGYEERRRLERDLHDGAQQRLVALGMGLRVAQRHLDDGTVDVDGLIDSAVAELGSAVAELREIAHGLRPSSLDDGLGPALTTLMKRMPIPVVLDLRAGTDVPTDVATTAYYVASEAVANAIKHGSADRIDLDVHHDSNQLRVRIQDNGTGGARLRPGAGLAGLSDRVAAAGGRLLVHSPLGTGTLVEAVLPCAS